MTAPRRAAPFAAREGSDARARGSRRVCECPNPRARVLDWCRQTPESIGLMRGESQSGAGIVLGKHSGRNAVSTRLAELGYDLDSERLNSVFARFKIVAEKKKGGLEDEELEALVTDSATGASWTLSGLQVTTGMSGIPTATVTMVGPDGVTRYVAATGTGPVDAVYKAIDRIIGVKVELETYAMQAVNEGIDALATTRVTIAPMSGSELASGIAIHSQSGTAQVRKFSGSGSDGDIVVASARAYVGAINKMISWNRRRAELAEAAGEKLVAPAIAAKLGEEVASPPVRAA